MKIATIIGARPQFIKAAPVSEKISSTESLSELIIHTGQHYEKNMSSIFFDGMNIPEPEYNLNINQMNYGSMISKMVDMLYSIISENQIDGVLVYGDTNSTLAGSLSANKLNLPIFHVEAGLRSNNQQMYEENNRIITDHLSSLLFCPTENSVQNLINEKISKGIVYVGDVMYDAFLKFNKKLKSQADYQESGEYILATIHRRENIDSHEKLLKIFNSLDKINKDQKILMPIHPHTLKQLSKHKIKTKINLVEPVGYQSMLSFLKNCNMVITDSGGLQKEAFFAKKKCLTIRNQTEWIELLKTGSNVLSHTDQITENYKKLKTSKCNFNENFYGNGKSSDSIVNSILKFLS